jgi:Domain of unknown function (DUF4926)
MTYRELDPVVLIRDIPDYDLRRGDLGAVVHVYGPSGVEVEFVRLSGLTQALITLEADDVRPVGEHDVPAVREVVGPVHGAV